MSRTSYTLAFFTGFVLSFVVLVCFHRFDVVSFSWMMFLLAVVFIVVTLGKLVFNEHKPWIMALWTRMRPLVSTLAPLTLPLWKKRSVKPSDWKEQLIVLQLNRRYLSEELKAFSLSWEHDRREYCEYRYQEELAFIPAEPHQAYWSEFRALTKSLTHLGTLANDARLELEDLDFYREWLGNLTNRFHSFKQQYIQQEKNVIHALSDARASQRTFVHAYQPVTRHKGYWIAYGSYATLEDLLKEGCVQPESLLPKMHSLQNDMESLFDQERSVL